MVSATLLLYDAINKLLKNRHNFFFSLTKSTSLFFQGPNIFEKNGLNFAVNYDHLELKYEKMKHTWLNAANYDE